MQRRFLFRGVLALAALLTVSAAPSAADNLPKGKTYHFGTHPARTNITFVSEADLETIHGVTNAASGTVTVDAKGGSARGALSVRVDSLKTGIALRDEHLRSADWLDAAKYPTIDLALLSVSAGKDGKTWSYKARLTIKGVAKDLKGSAKIRAIPDEIGKVLGAGSWVRVRTRFEVTLADFGIRVPKQIGAKVSGTWSVAVDLYGTTAAPKTKKTDRRS